MEDFTYNHIVYVVPQAVKQAVKQAMLHSFSHCDRSAQELQRGSKKDFYQWRAWLEKP
ncbi:MAG: hypothetical protein ACRCZS_15135 [Chroococcidiopsis sp.]